MGDGEAIPAIGHDGETASEAAKQRSSEAAKQQMVDVDGWVWHRAADGLQVGLTQGQNRRKDRPQWLGGLGPSRQDPGDSGTRRDSLERLLGCQVTLYLICAQALMRLGQPRPLPSEPNAVMVMVMVMVMLGRGPAIPASISRQLQAASRGTVRRCWGSSQELLYAD
ncbi:hypothetical protein E4U21_003599 [Claviceps maximensis]|nr:hypothetical protein E4U21_003599 [Claviceps maximensis]